jgi:hypothetical protein
MTDGFRRYFWQAPGPQLNGMSTNERDPFFLVATEV